MGMILILFIAEIFSVILQRIFCDNILIQKKINGQNNFLVWSGYFVIFNAATYILISFKGIIWLNLLIFVLTFFLTIRILYSNSNRTLITVTIFMYVSGMCAELFVYYGKELLFRTYDGDLTLLCTVLSKLVWFFIIKLTSLIIKTKRRVELNVQDWMEVFIVPAGSILILLSVFVTGVLENYIWGFITVFMVLMINVFTYYLYDKAKENMEKRIREEILERQCAYYIRQNRESIKWWKELRKFRHNMKQHYILENTYLEKHDYDALKRYCNENLLFLDKKKNVSNSGNIYIDSVVNYKADVAEKEGIELAVNIQVPQNAEMNAEDIIICLGNLLDNAIEAVRELQKDKIIRIQVTTEGANMVINIRNQYQNEVHKKRGRYLTNKKNNREHGMGLLSVRQIVEKYDGGMVIHDEDNVFDVMILMYNFLIRN